MPSDLLQKSRGRNVEGLLTPLGDDIRRRRSLRFHRQHGWRRSVARAKFPRLERPGRQAFGLGQPLRLRQGAGDRGWKTASWADLGFSSYLAV